MQILAHNLCTFSSSSRVAVNPYVHVPMPSTADVSLEVSTRNPGARNSSEKANFKKSQRDGLVSRYVRYAFLW